MGVPVGLVAVVGHLPHAGEGGGGQEDDKGQELGALVQDLQALDTDSRISMWSETKQVHFKEILSILE
jgi:hypothetical protein